MVDRTALEMRHTGNRIGGSNPSLSANNFGQTLRSLAGRQSARFHLGSEKSWRSLTHSVLDNPLVDCLTSLPRIHFFRTSMAVGLRETEASMYTLKDTPIFSCVRMSPTEMLDRLG